MEVKERGRLLTETFKRMNALGITTAEDIIEKLAEEIERYREKIAGLEKGFHASYPLDVLYHIPEPLLWRVYSVDIASDGNVSIYFDSQGDIVSPHPAE